MEAIEKYHLNTDPLVSLKAWYQDAKTCEQNPEAMTLATIDQALMRPMTRTVLFKGFKDGNLCFYTNYESVKAHNLNKIDEGSILFYWHVSKRQVRVQGRVEKMSEADSAKYFHSRDRQSQIASYISKQSTPIASKEELLERMREVEKEFEGKEIPLPKYWGGYIFKPYEFEFFLYGEYRINDRFLYRKENSNWIITRLQP